MEDRKIIIYETLFKKYGKQCIDKKELASEMGMSVSMINKLVPMRIGVPEFIKSKFGGENSKNGKILFPLISVAEFISRTNKVA